MLIQKEAFKAVSSGKYEEGLKAITALTKGDCNPADHRPPGQATQGARIRAGQASRSRRQHGKTEAEAKAAEAAEAAEKERKKKERAEHEGRDRQERGGKDRKGRKV